MKQLQLHIQHYIDRGVFSARFALIIENFCRDYLQLTSNSAPLLQLIELAAQQIQKPYPFGYVHQRIRQPFDYYAFGLELIRPLIDLEKSCVLGWDHLASIEKQLSRGENCLLLANHQIEPDPQVISLLLEPKQPKLAEEMFIVAGDRVTTDPLAAPLSMGCNLICIHSKKHLDHPPEQKEAKRQHNQRALQEVAKRFALGGFCLFVAPSGGRDRPNAQGQVEVAPFDPQSVEVFHLLSKQSPKAVHFYPLALATYALFPPPQEVQREIGEERKICRTAVHAAIGPELDLGQLGTNISDKKEQRRQRADAVWRLVCDLYHSLPKSQ